MVLIKYLRMALISFGFSFPFFGGALRDMEKMCSKAV